MENKDFTATTVVEKSLREAFDGVNNVRGWWSENITGSTEKLGDEFVYSIRDLHRCKCRLIEVIPNKKVVWEVLENYFSFVTDQSEWVGTKPTFELSEEDGKTQIHFTHVGLVPGHECYQICFDAWTDYITNSLRNLIDTGKGHPNPKEDASYETA